ncbi:MAG: lipopolysaccharide assembly protein LapA domain-containing protein [Gammaproteobacteria bacterium]|nr:lipopolysaccharide assembly protein LapA domain-containing protein [Gammaproteobacteria bacterium]
MTKIKVFVSVLLLLALTAFVLQNVAVVELRLLAWTVSLPRSAMVFIVLLVGVVLGWLWRGQTRRR